MSPGLKQKVSLRVARGHGGIQVSVKKVPRSIFWPFCFGAMEVAVSTICPVDSREKRSSQAEYG